MLAEEDECQASWDGFFECPLTLNHQGIGILPLLHRHPVSAGIRFRIDIPAYAYLQTAFLWLDAFGTFTRRFNARIACRRSANAPAWTNWADFLTAERTKAYQFIELEPWKGGNYARVNITLPMREVFALPGFVAGNHCAIFLEGPFNNYFLNRLWRNYAKFPYESQKLELVLIIPEPLPAPYPPPPTPIKPPPEQPPDCFALLDVVYSLQNTTAYVVAITDAPCHLWLRWTAIEPERHKFATTRRGRTWYWDIKNCFVEHHDLEQLEDGDTTNHTFKWTSWQMCTTRWYYFHGTRAGKAARSNTAYLKLHFADLFATIETETWTRIFVPEPKLYAIYEESWTM